ncbi:ketoacyl-ACP synthase III [Guyparkeria sp. 1SP6A2]|nr:ketoacyl-ACP synthase III [Guyparkeria sp. 1SP6A2]
MTHSRITGTGSYLPERVMTNHDLEQIVDTSDSWIRERTGIEQRHIAAEGQLTSDLAEPAARAALEAAGRVPEEVDLIIVATTTPDRTFPSTACLLQQKLGIHGPPAFDVQAVCTGFVYALSVADKFIKTGAARCALVVGAETLSNIINWNDRTTCVLFADGAGAVVLEASDEPGIIRTDIHADGSYESLLTTVKPDPETTDPERLADGTAFIEMRGNEVFRMAVNTLGRIVDQTMSAAGMTPKDIDWLVPHQANIRIIQATARKLGMSMERVVVTVGQHGNTSAASVPLALDVAVRDGRIKRGDVILMEAFGGGFTWGSALVRY